MTLAHPRSHVSAGDFETVEQLGGRHIARSPQSCEMADPMYFPPMNATIDRAGRLVVPKPILEAANLRPGTQVRFRLADGRVEIEPVPMKVTLERSGSLVVAVPAADGRPVLTQSDVDEAITAIRDETASLE